MEQLRPKVRALVDELLADVAARPRPVDLVEHFSLPLPARVICELLGVPPEDQHIFHAWSDTIMSDASRDLAEIRATIGKLAEYFGKLIADKRATPADDLMTALIAALRDRARRPLPTTRVAGRAGRHCARCGRLLPDGGDRRNGRRHRRTHRGIPLTGRDCLCHRRIDAVVASRTRRRQHETVHSTLKERCRPSPWIVVL
ncbi:MAG TPA: hypothetical protein VFC19_29335 [Candidatus Limnocylindrales bacterium]|nr:hypothetical protein [Candidatus Limnocylindrales bacterium]